MQQRSRYQLLIFKVFFFQLLQKRRKKVLSDLNHNSGKKKSAGRFSVMLWLLRIPCINCQPSALYWKHASLRECPSLSTMWHIDIDQDFSPSFYLGLEFMSTLFLPFLASIHLISPSKYLKNNTTCLYFHTYSHWAGRGQN